MRQRSKWFRSAKERKAFAAALERESRDYGKLSITQEERLVLSELKRRCAERGVSLAESLDAGLRLLGDTSETQVTLSCAVDAFLADSRRRGLRPKTIAGYATALSKPLTLWGDVRLHGVSRDQILALILSSYTNEESRRDLRGVLRNFFGWCAHPDRGWCGREVIEGLKWRANVQDRPEIGILKATEARQFLGEVPDRLKAGIALALFAGVRTAELQRMSRDAIAFDHRRVVVRAAWAKTRRARTLNDLPENLWEWLERYPPRGERVIPMNYRNFRRSCMGARVAAGLGERWPHNAFRHSFASYGYWRGLEWCIDIMGHVGGFQTFQRRYKGMVSAAESGDYFSILP